MGLTYFDSGVDIDLVASVLEAAKGKIAQTYDQNVVNGAGLFAGVVRIPGSSLLLAATADGVGTKLKIAAAASRYREIGFDVVNHCINDIVAMGARPFFFLDYFATGKFSTEIFSNILDGMVEACRDAGIILLGGETAEMPGVYALGDFDLAGFMLGIADEKNLLPRDDIKEGDLLVGLPSNGLHTNGFSLVRKVFSDYSLDSYIPELGCTLAEELLRPHKSYLDDVTRLRQLFQVKAVAHITGGGIPANLVRVLPKDMKARVIWGSWEVLPIFTLIRTIGNVNMSEMLRVFNMGIGIILVVDRSAKDSLKQSGYNIIGSVEPWSSGDQVEIVF
jgi:phosphoribosylformylglycinamidine cyclo-ligase